MKLKINLPIFIATSILIIASQLHFWNGKVFSMLEKFHFSTLRDVSSFGLLFLFVIVMKRLCDAEVRFKKDFYLSILGLIVVSVSTTGMIFLANLKIRSHDSAIEHISVEFIPKNKTVNIVKMYNEYFVNLRINNQSESIVDTKLPWFQTYIYALNLNWYKDCDLSKKPHKVTPIAFTPKITPSRSGIMEIPIDYRNIENGTYCIKPEMTEIPTANSNTAAQSSRQYDSILTVKMNIHNFEVHKEN